MLKNEKLIKIGTAAKMLGVSIDTLRRWDKKGKLRSLKSKGSHHRLYAYDKIVLMSSDPFSRIMQWLIAEKPEHANASYYFPNRGVFALGLKEAELLLQGNNTFITPPALIGALIGEIGNNAFDHNLGNWQDEAGVCFYLDPVLRKIIIADRGQGILKTLRQVRPGIVDDAEALKIAFTEILSGRAPEDRGNGLKFVRGIIAKYPVVLILQSGDALVEIGPQSDILRIKKSVSPIRGCVVTIEY